MYSKQVPDPRAPRQVKREGDEARESENLKRAIKNAEHAIEKYKERDHLIGQAFCHDIIVFASNKLDKSDRNLVEQHFR